MAAATTPYVAFADDDSWWAPGALTRAARAFDAHPRLAVVAARTLAGPRRAPRPHERGDGRSPCRPWTASGCHFADSRFVACGAVVRRDAFLAVGGFSDVVFFMGEEQMVALDLLAGWQLAYLDDVVAHHHPSSDRSRRAPSPIVRNDLLTTWMRRPLRVALGRTAHVVAAASRDPAHRMALQQLPARFARALAHRRCARGGRAPGSHAGGRARGAGRLRPALLARQDGGRRTTEMKKSSIWPDDVDEAVEVDRLGDVGVGGGCSCGGRPRRPRRSSARSRGCAEVFVALDLLQYLAPVLLRQVEVEEDEVGREASSYSPARRR